MPTCPSSLSDFVFNSLKWFSCSRRAHLRFVYVQLGKRSATEQTLPETQSSCSGTNSGEAGTFTAWRRETGGWRQWTNGSTRMFRMGSGQADSYHPVLLWLLPAGVVHLGGSILVQTSVGEYLRYDTGKVASCHIFARLLSSLKAFSQSSSPTQHLIIIPQAALNPNSTFCERSFPAFYPPHFFFCRTLSSVSTHSSLTWEDDP